MEESKTYCVRLISNELTRCVRPVSTVAGESYELVLPAEAGALDPVEGWRFAFGEEGHETNLVLITGIHPGADFSAELTGVDYAPGVYMADQGEIPAWNPNITRSPFVQPGAPDAPRILAMTSDESVMARDASGRLQARISVAYALAGGRVPAETVECQVRPVGEAWRSVPSVAAGKALSIADVSVGKTYDVRIRSVFAGVASAWVESAGHVVLGLTAPPPDVPGLLLSGGRLTWTYPDPPPDFVGFKVRFTADPSAAWARASTLPGDPLLTEQSLDVSGHEGTLIWLVRAVDSYGNMSERAAQATVNLGDRVPENVMESWPQAPAWGGSIAGGAVDGGKLKAAQGYYIKGLADAVALSGERNAPEMGADWSGLEYLLELDTWGYDGELVVTRTGTDGLALEYSTPSSRMAVLGNAAALALSGDRDAKEIEGRTGFQAWPGGVPCGGRVWLRATCPGGAQRGEIEELTPTVDVPDVEEILEDVVISTAGTRLALGTNFRAIKAIVLALQDDGGGATGVLIVDKNATTGPLLQAQGANALCDVRVVGYC